MDTLTERPAQIYDLLVIGGGINGTGIARDAAGRGLTVLLCEQHDLASSTSSASTKLIHGGLRYLEHYEFSLVREALIEREVLYQAAPHIIKPLSFVLPHHRELRPAWLLRAGLFLYDHLGGRKLLPPSHAIRFKNDPTGKPLQDHFTKGFKYADCWVDDARLVVLNAIDAKKRGATILTRTRCESLRSDGNIWQAQLSSASGSQTYHCKAVINAAGPWAMQVREKALQPGEHALRLAKGSHIITKRLFEGEHAYIFQQGDGRIIFAIPYEQSFTLIGTTDLNFEGDPAEVVISKDEIDYLCKAANGYFKQSISPEDVLWSYSGVRPLYNDGKEDTSAVTRNYVLELDRSLGPPLLNIYGGKLTTYRKLAEHALAKILPILGNDEPAWTAETSLPGGDIGGVDISGYCQAMQDQYPWLDAATVNRLCCHYGTRLHLIIDGANSEQQLGRHFGDGLYEAELIYLRDHEWACTAEDVLWRRSKLGLHLPEDAQQAVRDWFDQPV